MKGHRYELRNLAPEAAILAAQRQLQIDRAHEDAWRTLMRTQPRATRPGAA